MLRAVLPALLLLAPIGAFGNELRISQLEADLRDLRLQLQDQQRQIAALQMPAAPPAPATPPMPRSSTSTAVSAAWLDAAHWQQLEPGMSELQVIALLGAPTSLRGDADRRVLLYAMEIGQSGFLAGSVTLQDGRLIELQQPTLR